MCAQKELPVTIESETQQLEYVTHILDQLLREKSGNEIDYSTAKSLVEMKINSIVDNDTSISDELEEDLLRTLRRANTTTTDDGKITQVETVGPRPTWLEMVTDEVQNADPYGEPTFRKAREKSARVDTKQKINYDKITCLTAHQPGLLKENGMVTCEDVLSKTPEELANSDSLTLTKSTAKKFVNQVKEQYNNAYDPEHVADYAYKKEQQPENENNNPLGTRKSNSTTIAEVKIPAGRPRSPEYEKINVPREVFGVPVLEHPTLNLNTIQSIFDNADTFEQLYNTIRSYAEYEHQANNLISQIKENHEKYNNPSEFAANEDLTQYCRQKAITDAILKDALEKVTEELDIIDEIKENNNEKINAIANRLDRALENRIPTKARLKLYELVTSLVQKHTSTESSDQTSIKELLRNENNRQNIIEQVSTPVQLDHPAIKDLSEFPEYKPQTLLPENNNISTEITDVEYVSHLYAKGEKGIILMGHAGVGKDTLFKMLTAATNRPMINIDIDNTMISQDLLGIHTVEEDGSVTFKEGVIPTAAKYGYHLNISEINTGSGDLLTAIHQALESNSKIHVKSADEVIEKHPSFRVTGTCNPNTEEYNGTKELNHGTQRRFVIIKKEYLDKEDEAELLYEMANYNDKEIITLDEAEKLVQMANQFRDNQLDYPRISTTHLEHIVEAYERIGNLTTAAKVVIKGILKPEPIHDEELTMNRIENNL